MSVAAPTAVRSWIDLLARAGYAARGIVYVIVGGLGVLAAFTPREVQGTEGALTTLLLQPFGTVLVGLVAFGLVAFCVWRLVQAIRDPDGHGREAKGLLIRAGLLGSALSYAVLAFLAIGLAIGSRSGSGNGAGTDPSREWIAALNEMGVAWLAVYVIAAVVFGVGVAHLIKGWRAGFVKYFRCPASVMSWLNPLGRSGLVARGVVFVIVSALIVSGSLAYNAEQRPGLADALRAVQGYAFGWLILLVIALGLLAFGLYSLAEARYRHVAAN